MVVLHLILAYVGTMLALATLVIVGSAIHDYLTNKEGDSHE